MSENRQDNTPASRAGAFLGDALMLALAAVAVVASFRGEPADAYDFPRLTSALLLVFALVNLGRNVLHPPAPPLSLALCRRLLPGVLIAVAYIYVCDIIGFYLAAAVAFVLLAAWYRPEPRDRRQWVWLAVATAVVMGCVYMLFDVVLAVQTPEPFWVD